MANKTLAQILAEYRETQQQIVNGTPTKQLLSNLNIDGSLYTIQDVALESLASEIESRLSSIESSADSLDGRLDVIEGADTVEGSIAKAEKDAKAYAKELVDAILGGDSESVQDKITTIKALYEELKGTEGGIADTLIDKLNTLTAGLGKVGEGTAEERNKTVKEYVDEQVAASNSSTTDAINALDANVDSTGGTHVSVNVVEADGKITSVTVSEDDIASAQELTEFKSEVDSQNQVVAASLTDLNSRKANKEAISTDNLNNWVIAYDSASDTLSWTSTTPAVYVPTTGKTL